MSEDTPATSTDNALGTEGDSDQLPGEDTLVEQYADDNRLDEVVAPPEEPRPNHFGETPWEEEHGEPHDLRLEQEEPEVWDSQQTTTPQDSTARSAEEAAIHVVEEP